MIATEASDTCETSGFHFVEKCLEIKPEILKKSPVKRRQEKVPNHKLISTDLPRLAAEVSQP
jgi:hypothetical protein